MNNFLAFCLGLEDRSLTETHSERPPARHLLTPFDSKVSIVPDSALLPSTSRQTVWRIPIILRDLHSLVTTQYPHSRHGERRFPLSPFGLIYSESRVITICITLVYLLGRRDYIRY